MIGEGDGWKFTSHIEENAIYEDQLVEHSIVGHRAVRRVYSKRLNLDEEASAGVRRQLELGSRIEHPGFQRVFFAETVEEQVCVYGELMDGQTLDVLTRHKKFRKSDDWAEAALLIVDLAREFETIGIGFDRLTLASMKLRWNLLRVATRYPTGSLTPGVQPESRFYRRLIELPEIGGAYVAEHGVPVEAGLQRFKDLLYFMATSQTVLNVEGALAKAREREAGTGSRNISQLGVDGDIEALLLRLHDPASAKGISNLKDLRRALGLLAPGVAKPSATVPAPTFAPITPASSMPPPAIPARPSTAAIAKPVIPVAPAPVPAPPPVAREEAPVAPSPAPRAAESPAASAQRSSSTAAPLQMTGRGREAEDAEEDRSYLYPSAAPAATAVSDSDPGKISSSGSAGSGSMASEPAARRSSGAVRMPSPAARQAAGGAVKMIVIVIVIIGALAAGGFAVMAFLDTKKVNQPPTASFAQLPASAKVNQSVALDASASNDPEGAPLKYQWSVPGLGITNYKIQPNSTPAAKTTTLQIFVTGTYEVKLEVFDGAAYSPAATQSIQIVSSP